MKTIDNNKPAITFGIAFKPYTNSRGVRTADMLDLQEEIKMYKSITEKLNKDVLVKTDKGVKSENFTLEKEDNKHNQMMRYFDKDGEVFFFNDNMKVQNVDKHFAAMRKAFDKIFNK